MFEYKIRVRSRIAVQTSVAGSSSITPHVSNAGVDTVGV